MEQVSRFKETGSFAHEEGTTNAVHTLHNVSASAKFLEFTVTPHYVLRVCVFPCVKLHKDYVSFKQL